MRFKGKYGEVVLLRDALVIRNNVSQQQITSSKTLPSHFSRPKNSICLCQCMAKSGTILTYLGRMTTLFVVVIYISIHCSLVGLRFTCHRF